MPTLKAAPSANPQTTANTDFADTVLLVVFGIMLVKGVLSYIAKPPSYHTASRIVSTQFTAAITK